MNIGYGIRILHFELSNSKPNKVATYALQVRPGITICRALWKSEDGKYYITDNYRTQVSTPLGVKSVGSSRIAKKLLSTELRHAVKLLAIVKETKEAVNESTSEHKSSQVVT